MDLAELRRMANAVAEIARDKATAGADTGHEMTISEVAEWVDDFTTSPLYQEPPESWELG